MTLHLLTHLRGNVSQMGLALRGGASDFMVMVTPPTEPPRSVFVRPVQPSSALRVFGADVLVLNGVLLLLLQPLQFGRGRYRREHALANPSPSPLIQKV